MGFCSDIGHTNNAGECIPNYERYGSGSTVTLTSYLVPIGIVLSVLRESSQWKGAICPCYSHEAKRGLVMAACLRDHQADLEVKETGSTVDKSSALAICYCLGCDNRMRN